MRDDQLGAIRAHGQEAALGLAEQLWPCYRQVFDDFDDFATWRTTLFERHATRGGYRLVTAEHNSAVVGFGWGYIGE